MVFAEATMSDLLTALIVSAISILAATTALIVAGITYLKKKIEKKIEATDTTKATEEVKQVAVELRGQVSDVHEAINGNGLTGSVRRVEGSIRRVEEAVTRIEGNQKDHEEKDDIRFARIEKYIGGP